MTSKYIISIIFVFLGLFLNAQENLPNRQFYYYKNERFYLEIDYSRISVISERKLNIDSIKQSISSFNFNIKKEGKNYTRLAVVPIERTSKTMQNKEVFISEIEFSNVLKKIDYNKIILQFSKEVNVIKVMPTYTVSGQKLGNSNNFYVKLFKGEDRKKLIELAKKHSIQVLGYNEFMPLWFTLSCDKESSLSNVEAANLFYEMGLFESTEPELLYHNLLLSNDHYFENQWGLKNTGQHCNANVSNVDICAENAWSLTTGSSNIRVAIFDQGIKMDHPDLINNIFGTGYDAEENTTPSFLRDFHGTPCAGIVGAQQNNTIGISGVTPNSKLISISINLNWGNTPQQLANGFNWSWQNGADIISNSWGGYTPSSIIDDAIINTLSQGRNGKGTVVVFASGNENNTAIRYPGNSNPDILVVGAISPKGERKSYSSCDNESWGSCYGTELDIVAPGVFIPTTTYTGGYTQTFNGTSSACPHVAGVAALVLSVNPNLTALQVRDIIESSAQKVGDYNYQTKAGRPNGTWHEEVGYGLIDAFAAVQAAQPCSGTTNLTNQTVTSNTTVNGCNVNVQNVNVQNNSKLTIDAQNSTTINGTFEIRIGSELEIK